MMWKLGLTRKNVILKILTCLIFSSSMGQAQVRDKKYYDELTAAITYAYALEYMNNELIPRQQPDLKARSIKVQMDFNKFHSRAVENAAKILGHKLGVSRSELKKLLLEGQMDLFSNNLYSRGEVLYYLEHFETERIFGNHEVYSSFVQTLLSHNPDYIEHPQKEFLDKFVVELNSRGHHKAKGLNLRIKIPKSWETKPGERPNIMWLTKNLNNEIICSIAVQDIIPRIEAEIGPLSPEERNEFQSKEIEPILVEVLKEDAKKMFDTPRLKNLRNMRVKDIVLDGQPCVKNNVNATLVENFIEEEVSMIHYQVIYKNYIIVLGFTITKKDSKKSDQYNILTDLIARSLIIDSKWEKY